MARPSWFTSQPVSVLNTLASSSAAWDNGYDVPVGGNYRRRSALARFRMTTNAPSIAIDDWPTMNTTQPSLTHIVVFVDGVYYTVLGVTGDAAVWRAATNLPVGTKTLDIIESCQNLSGPTGTQLGIWTRNFYVPAGNTTTILAPTAPTRRLVVYGDSISVGVGNLIVGPNWTIPARNGWVSLLRAIYPGRVTNEGWGSRSFWDDYTNKFAGVAGLVAQIVSLCDGTVTNEIWLTIGTNDYGLNLVGTGNIAAWQTNFQAFLTQLRAALPTTRIFVQSPIVRTVETANFGPGGGITLPTLRTAQQNAFAAAAISNATFVDGVTNIPITTAELADGVHPTNPGHIIIEGAIATYLGV